MNLERLTEVEAFASRAEEWDRLAVLDGSPFLTTAWFTSWWQSIGDGGFLALLLRDERGSLMAGACLRRPAGRSRPVSSASGELSNDWDVVARDDAARSSMWRVLCEVADTSRLQLNGFRENDPTTDVARTVLEEFGYRVWVNDRRGSPILVLPESFDVLLESRTRKMRTRLRYLERSLEGLGRLELRVGTDVGQVDRDLTELLRIEAAGWKGRAGSAIACDRRLEQLYRRFARAAAEAGWLRLYLLELDGQPIAGDFGCIYGTSSWLMKTAYDERLAKYSPGLVLRARALQAAIDERCEHYEFLGGADEYKLRWTSDLRPRANVIAYRGAWTMAYHYRATVQPTLARLSRSPASRWPEFRRRLRGTGR